MTKAEQKAALQAKEEFLGKVADLMADCPDDVCGVVALHPTIAKESGRSEVVAIPSLTASDKPNDDGFPQYIGIGQTGKGGRLEQVDDHTRLNLSLGFVTEKPKAKDKPVGKVWGSK